MRLLVLGGTEFLGRHFVKAASAAGHEITIFHRGGASLPDQPGVLSLQGDRYSDLRSLASSEWDAVIDMSGYTPGAVRATAELLGQRVGQYVFVSSVSAYSGSTPPVDEETPLLLSEEGLEEPANQLTYGARKAACERELERFMPGRSLIIRPGVIVGPYDYTERLRYWIGRVRTGGEVLIPDSPRQPMQLIDARDLAQWMLRMTERRESGVYNAAAPSPPLAFGEFIEECRVALNPAANLVPVPMDFLEANDVRPWLDLPLWLGADPSQWWTFSVATNRAISAGLKTRSLEITVRDTAESDHLAAPESKNPAWRGLWAIGMTRERELHVLEKWRKASAG